MDITWNNGNTQNGTHTKWSNMGWYSATSIGPLGTVHDWKKIVIQYMNLTKYEKDGLPCDGFNCGCVKADCDCGYDDGNLRHKYFRWCPTAKVNCFWGTFLEASKQPSKEATQTSQPDKKTKKRQRGQEKREEKERKE